MRMQRTLGLLLLSVLPCEVSFAQHSDLELFNAGGQVGVEPRIAEGEFGEALNPAYRASDPGLESDPGELLLHGETPLPAGAIVGYELVPFTLEGTTKTLFYWNGVGSPDFVSHSFAHRLKISDPTESFSFQYDNLGLSGGLDFALTSDGDGPDPAGFLHTHLLFDLIDATGQPAAIPTAGVYAFATTFSVAGLADSEPVYWLLAAGADEEIHEAAVDYISRAVGIVPEPTTLVLVCFSLLPVAGRRKRRSRTRAGAR